MKKKIAWFTLTCAAALALSGCASYYKVTDPASGRTYYTGNIEKRGSGAICFKDENTKTRITLSTSEVMEITEDQFKANIRPR